MKTIPIIVFWMLILAGCGTDDAGVAGGPPDDWADWARWVEANHPVIDAQGHGPDIGSGEWARAVDRRLGITDPDGHGPDVGSAEWRSAVERAIGDTLAADLGLG